MQYSDHVINGPLLKMARDRLAGREKAAFVPGGGGGAPGGDPSGGMGGQPSAGGAPGGDPSGGAGAAPAPAGGASGGGGMDPSSIMPMVQQMVQQQMMQQGGGGAGGKPLAPKIDEKVVLTQIVKLLARVCDHLGIQVPASEMVVGQQDLMGMANATSTGAPMPGMDPSAGGGAGAGAGAQQAGAMPPIEGIQPAGQPGAMKGAAWRSNGVAFDGAGLVEIGDRAAAIALIRRGGR